MFTVRIRITTFSFQNASPSLRFPLFSLTTSNLADLRKSMFSLFWGLMFRYGPQLPSFFLFLLTQHTWPISYLTIGDKTICVPQIFTTIIPVAFVFSQIPLPLPTCSENLKPFGKKFRFIDSLLGITDRLNRFSNILFTKVYLVLSTYPASYKPNGESFGSIFDLIYYYR